MSYSDQLIQQLIGPKFKIDNKIADFLIFQCNNLREIPLDQRTSSRVRNELESSLVMFPDLTKEETFKTELVDVLKDYVSKVLGITAQKGNVLKEIEHKEWFQDFKETEKYDPYYWSRLKLIF